MPLGALVFTTGTIQCNSVFKSQCLYFHIRTQENMVFFISQSIILFVPKWPEWKFDVILCLWFVVRLNKSPALTVIQIHEH